MSTTNDHLRYSLKEDNPPTPPGEIAQLMASCVVTLSNVHHTLDKLVCRIDPILDQTPTNPKEDQTIAASSCAVSRSLAEILSSLQQLSRILASTEERVQL